MSRLVEVDLQRSVPKGGRAVQNESLWIGRRVSLCAGEDVCVFDTLKNFLDQHL